MVEEETTVDAGTPTTTHYYYDEYGTLLKQSGSNETTRNIYDSFGRILKEVDAEHYVAANDTFGANSENMASSSGAYSVDANTTRYTYNNTTWNLAEKINSDGITTNYTYDTNGNQTVQNFDLYTLDETNSGALSDVKIGTQDFVDFNYNSDGSLSTKNFGNNQSIHYTYNSDGSVNSVQYVKNGTTTNAFSHVYDSFGYDRDTDNINNTFTKHYSGGLVEICDYDEDPYYGYSFGDTCDETEGAGQSLGETVYVDDIPRDYLSEYFLDCDVFYNVSGGTNAKIYKNYNKTDDRLNSSSVNLGSKNGTQLMSTAYSYSGDKVSEMSNVIGSITKAYNYQYNSGNQISKVSSGSDDVDYIYGSNNQLVRVNDETLNKTFIYNYNSRGNITSKSIYSYTTADPISSTPTSTDTYTYGDSNWPDKLTSYNGQTITNDEIGNPLSYKGYTMTWTAGRLLDSMVGNNQSLYFKYGEDGNRTQKTVGTTVTRYTTIDGRITYQNDGTNVLQFHYDHDNELAGVMINGTEYIYVKNLQGDIVSIVDTAGTVVVNYSYDAWGKVQSITGSLASTIGQLNPMRYRGYYQDTETGLYYLQSRYYDPDTCRMLNADDQEQIRSDLSSLEYNLYSYCLNNPIMGTDPSGGSTWQWVGYGIQIEVNIGCAACGVEVVWFTNTKIKVKHSRKSHMFMYMEPWEVSRIQETY